MYITKPGERWDEIARSACGNELRADSLMESNIRHIGVYAFDYGVSFSVPATEAAAETSLPPWRRPNV